MPAQRSSPEPQHPVVRFLLDGRVHEVRDVPPTRTVLNYLREDLGRTGTKEGCAEGDCGACTVVVAERSGDGVSCKAVNACIQFVPTLDGKALFTVESLKQPDGSLHPVQQAMVDCHGSQCGFCTPGFVMSLFALYKSADHPDRDAITDALAGNLCRCTGYRPIIEAARKMYEYGSVARDAGDRELAQALRGIEPADTLALKGAGGEFYAPRTLEALAALRVEHPDARLLAGGTDVGLWVTKQQRDLPKLIYVGEVAELKRVERTATHLEIGAAATLTDVFDDLGTLYPDMGELLRRFASPPIRNAGTLGGNIANGSPIGDSMPPLIALGTTVVLRKGAATREIALEDLYLAYQKTALEQGEFVERMRVPLPAANRTFRTYKISKRFDQDISAVCAAFCIVLDGSRVREARVAFGGMAATPKRAGECERALIGHEWNEATVRAAMSMLDRDYAPIRDMRATPEYRRMVARNLLYKFYVETSGAAVQTRVLSYAGESA